MVRPEIKKKRQQAAEAALKSHKERKRLEKVVLRKRHKIDRNQVLAEIKRVQMQPGQLAYMHSTSSMQTKGLRKFFEEKIELNEELKFDPEKCLDAASLIRRKKRKLKQVKDESESSSSEDTDAMSTDTEIYDENDHHLVPLLKTENGTNQSNTESSIPQSTSTLLVKSAEEKSEIKIETRDIIPGPKYEPAIYVMVNRKPEVDKSRAELPIIGEEQKIMEEIRYNDIVIISGETGSGKTTQLPQFLYEAGYTLNGKIIGITEPRRVAAVTMSERVGHELNLSNEEISYQIRFSGNVSEKTQIKFMTDGVLLKECQHDFLLAKYSALIIDEAHERSVFSDILIGLLSRIVPLRRKRGNPLKLIIMSATLRVSDFTENHFLFPETPPLIKIDARQFPVTLRFAKRTPGNYLEACYKKVSALHDKMPRGGILVFVTSQMDVKVLCKKLKKKSGLHCLGLYAMLPIEKQQLVFKKPPEGWRLCVIATNVAETSITIPNIKYVVDCGLEKRKQYNLITGISQFITTWTSKSSAEQRAGRAGRTGPGFCFRLYSSAVYTNDFEDFAEPQILQKPVEDVLLQMKTMNIDNVVNFPFPTRPSIEALKNAEKRLVLLGALDDTKRKDANYLDKDKTEYASRPTPLGKSMAKYAVSARCSKMIVLANKDLLPHVIALVSALTVREMFINGNEHKELRKTWLGHGHAKLLGDFMVMLRAVKASESYECSSKLCQTDGLRPKAMLEIDKLRKHLSDDKSSKQRMKKLTEEQSSNLRQLLLSSFCDHIASRVPDGQVDNDTSKNLKNAYECMETEEPVYISPESALRGQYPDFIIYKELYKGEKKTYMRDIAIMDPTWLPQYEDKLYDFKHR